MTTRLLLAALAFTTTLALAGCSSSDDGSGGDPTDTATGTTTTGDGGNGGNGGGSGGNATAPEEFSCTAQAGQVVGGGGSNLVTVSGCNFVTLSGDAVYVGEDIPAGCDSLYDEDADGQYEGAPEAGTTYTSGTVFGMGCGATNQSGEGTITIRYL